MPIFLLKQAKPQVMRLSGFGGPTCGVQAAMA
jgi:hypothetical protein